uniref:Uncharacterized protein n=1 Tax=Oryza rufipogon TaxID=4529 RepID=A0A0E0PDY8_ORYRU
MFLYTNRRSTTEPAGRPANRSGVEVMDDTPALGVERKGKEGVERSTGNYFNSARVDISLYRPPSKCKDQAIQHLEHGCKNSRQRKDQKESTKGKGKERKKGGESKVIALSR